MTMKIDEIMEVKNEVREVSKVKTEDRLERLGLKAAAGQVKELKTMERKLTIAHEHYRFVRQEQVDKFNKDLRKKTLKNYTYQTLAFTPISDYKKTPPSDVLDKLEEAINLKCFDSFEIASIMEVKEDPLLFGRINNCPDRFFIAQWDNDVKIEDLIKENEGYVMTEK